MGDGESGQGREVRFLKTYTVFNGAQIDEVPERFATVASEIPALLASERIAHVDEWGAGLGARGAHGGAQAFYAIGGVRIQLPPFESFHNAHDYYTTRRHETVHWARQPTRLD